METEGTKYEYQYVRDIIARKVNDEINYQLSMGWEPISVNKGSGIEDREILFRREIKKKGKLKYKVDALIARDQKNYNIECIIESNSKSEAILLFQRDICNNDSKCIIEASAEEFYE